MQSGVARRLQFGIKDAQQRRVCRAFGSQAQCDAIAEPYGAGNFKFGGRSTHREPAERQFATVITQVDGLSIPPLNTGEVHRDIGGMGFQTDLRRRA